MSLPECAALECERLKARLKAAERLSARAERCVTEDFARVQSQDGSDGEGWALPWGAPVSLLLRHAAITQALYLRTFTPPWK